MGFDKLYFYIIKICDLREMAPQQERANYYIQKYLPLLNPIFKSNLSVTQSYYSLYEILKLRQLRVRTNLARSCFLPFFYTNK